MDRGTAKDRRSTRRRRALVACALALLVLPGAAGCGESGEEKAAARRRAVAAARHARELVVGRKVFATHCAACHAMEGKPRTGPLIEWEAPLLDMVKPKRHYVEWRVDSGGFAMASFSSEIPEARRRALITYVTEVSGSEVEDGDPPPDVLDAGREVFAEHCARCHGIEGRAMTGEPLYTGMDFNLVKPSVRLVQRNARRGVAPDIDLMPAFGNVLTDEQIDAVAAYVNAVAAEGREAPESPFESP